MNIYPISSEKAYRCTRCAHETRQSTNHYGETYSWGRFNTCPNCPPWAKYSEYGGSTTWECVDQEPIPTVKREETSKEEKARGANASQRVNLSIP